MFTSNSARHASAVATFAQQFRPLEMQPTTGKPER